ncbi:nucleotidyltransferase family protein [Roseomonas sp. BN140053]|uniref:nucleotidyltransferase family protein n=1 Tax=Roseomonas sp. BN140053 TaxID=3391898 RepID=UPI0039E79662
MPDPAADRLRAILRGDAALMRLLPVLHDLGLPDWWLVAGSIYGSAWNALTGRPREHGLRDYDLAYFDPDTSWDAENAVIARVAAATAGLALPAPVQARNQARVHLWFAGHFGIPFGPPLRNTVESMRRYASQAHAVGVRLDAAGRLDVAAPFGLEDLLSLVIRPNPALNNRAAHLAKGARSLALWPEATLLPWPDVPA